MRLDVTRRPVSRPEGSAQEEPERQLLAIGEWKRTVSFRPKYRRTPRWTSFYVSVMFRAWEGLWKDEGLTLWRPTRTFGADGWSRCTDRLALTAMARANIETIRQRETFLPQGS